MSELEALKEELSQIRTRNKRVEAEKAWETSWTRKGSVIFLTYLVMVLVFTVIKVDRPFVNAIVPTLGYFLSTVSVGIFKNWWIARQK